MKQLILILSTVMAFGSVQANDDLAASMKIIGQQFKVIVAGIQAQSLSEDHLSAVEILQKEIATSAQFFPDKATTEAQKLEYSTLMNDLLIMAQDLETLMKDAMAIEPLDLSAVIQKFIEMDETRKKGHSLFKED